MTDVRIAPETRITLNFSLALENGDLVDSTFDTKPATFVYGDGSLLPGFEAAMQGLKVGDRRQFNLPPEQAFGASNPQNEQQWPRAQFADMELSEGLMIIFKDPGNNELPGTVKAFDDNMVTIDFNHPLAGRTITFDVEILAVEPA